MKFMMILNDIDWFWSHRLPLAKAILNKGWDLNLATHNADKDQKLRDMNVIGWALPKHGRGSDIINQFALMLGIYKNIKQCQPDIIHAITIRYAFYAGLVTRIMGYKPVVFTVAGLGSLYTAPGFKMKLLRAIILPLLRFAFGGSTKNGGKFIIFQNPDDQQAMISTNIVKIENTAVIRGSGVDITEFSYASYEETEELPIILFTSRLLKEKGIEDFIEAARILKLEGVQARFQVAGDVYADNARSMTRGAMQAAHDTHVIEWLGQVSDMPDLLRRSMMVVLPSYYGEGVPKVLLEAAAMGRPIITCDAPGCREAVKHDVNGVLVAPQNAVELAREIKALMQDSERRFRYGAAGRARVEKDFHADFVVQKTMDAYINLLSKA